MRHSAWLPGLIMATMSPAFAETESDTLQRAESASAAINVAEREIRDILDQNVRAALSLETASAQSQIADFERNYARDYISVASNGTVFSLGDILTEIRRNGPNSRRFSSVEIEDAQVRIYGDTAVAAYLMRYAWEDEDGPSDRFVRESAVFIRRDGRWLRILEHRSNLAPPVGSQ